MGFILEAKKARNIFIINSHVSVYATSHFPTYLLLFLKQLWKVNKKTVHNFAFTFGSHHLPATLSILFPPFAFSSIRSTSISS